MKRSIIALGIGLCMALPATAQSVLSTDSCRTLALEHNKELLMAREKITAAHYERKAAFTHYLPQLTATGSYMHNQDEMSLLSHEQKSKLSSMGTNLASQLGQLSPNPKMQAILAKHPELLPLLGAAQQYIVVP